MITLERAAQKNSTARLYGLGLILLSLVGAAVLAVVTALDMRTNPQRVTFGIGIVFFLPFLSFLGLIFLVLGKRGTIFVQCSFDRSLTWLQWVTFAFAISLSCTAAYAYWRYFASLGYRLAAPGQ